MPVDLQLIRTLLIVLANNESRGELTEEVIAIDCELRLRRPMISHQVRAALCEMKRLNWAAENSDEWGQPVWAITVAGKEKNGHF